MHVSSFVIRATIDEMKAVARAAGNASQSNDMVGGDWTATLNDLGSTPEHGRRDRRSRSQRR